MRPHGTPDELARRRERAVAAYHDGQAPTTIARVLGVDRSTVHRWVRLAQQPGGLAPKPLDRPPRLSDDDLARLEPLLRHGARAHGWDSDLWTAARVAALILRTFGVAHHPEHVRKILKHRLGWTSQKPQTRATERDEDGLRRWVEQRFPRIVRAAQERDAALVFEDESGFQLSPTVRRTFAPRGETPILPAPAKRDRISALSAITLSPRQRRPGLVFRLLPDQATVHAEDVVAFLKDLKRRLGRFTIVWDRGRIHSRSRVVRAYLAGQPDIVVEDLPGYAPELNPDELVWGWAKYGRMGNYAAPNVEALRERVHAELEYLRTHPYALWKFMNHTELPIIQD
jgi:transposase